MHESVQAFLNPHPCKTSSKVGGEVSGSEEGGGSADVWYRGRFAWEYKGKHKDLKTAYRQLLLYREDLENPPLLVVSDMDRFEVHTNFTDTAKKVYAFDNDDLGASDNEALRVLRALFEAPSSLKPGVTAEGVTKEVAERFSVLAEGLRGRGVEPRRAARFLDRLLFCLFAEDVGLLPQGLFTRIVQRTRRDPERFARNVRALFGAMAEGGEFFVEDIRHFNGGLFSDDDVVELRAEEIGVLAESARLEWGSVEPAVFGTLFERSLDPLDG